MWWASLKLILKLAQNQISSVSKPGELIVECTSYIITPYLTVVLLSNELTPVKIILYAKIDTYVLLLLVYFPYESALLGHFTDKYSSFNSYFIKIFSFISFHLSWKNSMISKGLAMEPSSQVTFEGAIWYTKPLTFALQFHSLHPCSHRAAILLDR